MTDPLAPLAELPGVAAAGEEAREALGRAHRHRTNLRGWPTTAAEAAPRAARASSCSTAARCKYPRPVSPIPCWLVAAWHVLTTNTNYHDLGDDYFITRDNPEHRRRRDCSNSTASATASPEPVVA